MKLLKNKEGKFSLIKAFIGALCIIVIAIIAYVIVFEVGAYFYGNKNNIVNTKRMASISDVNKTYLKPEIKITYERRGYYREGEPDREYAVFYVRYLGPTICGGMKSSFHVNSFNILGGTNEYEFESYHEIFDNKVGLSASFFGCNLNNTPDNNNIVGGADLELDLSNAQQVKYMTRPIITVQRTNNNTKVDYQVTIKSENGFNYFKTGTYKIGATKVDPEMFNLNTTLNEYVYKFSVEREGFPKVTNISVEDIYGNPSYINLLTQPKSDDGVICYYDRNYILSPTIKATSEIYNREPIICLSEDKLVRDNNFTFNFTPSAGDPQYEAAVAEITSISYYNYYPSDYEQRGEVTFLPGNPGRGSLKFNTNIKDIAGRSAKFNYTQVNYDDLYQTPYSIHIDYSSLSTEFTNVNSDGKMNYRLDFCLNEDMKDCVPDDERNFINEMIQEINKTKRFSIVVSLSTKYSDSITTKSNPLDYINFNKSEFRYLGQGPTSMQSRNGISYKSFVFNFEIIDNINSTITFNKELFADKFGTKLGVSIPIFNNYSLVISDFSRPTCSYKFDKNDIQVGDTAILTVNCAPGANNTIKALRYDLLGALTFSNFGVIQTSEFNQRLNGNNAIITYKLKALMPGLTAINIAKDIYTQSNGRYLSDNLKTTYLTVVPAPKDVNGPKCKFTFGGASKIQIGKTTKLLLVCTDDNTIDASKIGFSPLGTIKKLQVTNVRRTNPVTDTKIVMYEVTVKGKMLGNGTIRLNAKSVKDVYGNVASMITSPTIKVSLFK